MYINEEMDFPEFYDRFMNDLHGYSNDCKMLTFMLTKAIEFILDEVNKRNYDSDDCREWNHDISKIFDAYSESIVAYCYKLKSKYKEQFDFIDPKNLEKIRRIKEQQEEYVLKEFKEKMKIRENQ